MEDQDRQRLAAAERDLASVTARLNALAEGNLGLTAAGFRLGSIRIREVLAGVLETSGFVRLHYGTDAERQASTDYHLGVVWCTSDTDDMYQGTGSAWQMIGGASGAAPGTHKATHQHGGADAVATATPGANVIPKAGAGGKLAAGFLQEVLAYADLIDDPITTHAGDGGAHHALVSIGADAAHSLAMQVLSAVLAGAAQVGHVGTAAQTFAGQKTFGDGIKTDTVAEETGAAGVTIDDTLIQDNKVTPDAGTAAAYYYVDAVGDTFIYFAANDYLYYDISANFFKLYIDNKIVLSFKNTEGKFRLSSSIAVDHTSCGTLQEFTAGENLVYGNFCYCKSDGKMWKASANAIATAPAVAMAMATISGNAAGDFLMSGTARDDSWSWTVGALLYLSETAGAIVEFGSIGTDTDDVVQVIDWAIDATHIRFDPQLMVVEHT